MTLTDYRKSHMTNKGDFSTFKTVTVEIDCPEKTIFNRREERLAKSITELERTIII